MKNLLIVLLLFLTGSGFSQSAPLKKAVSNAYELEKTEKYSDAKKIFQDYLKNQKVTQPEKLFINSYISFYTYILTDYQDFQKLEVAFNAIKNIAKRNNFETELLLNLYTHKYFYYAENNNWEYARDVALEGFKIKDFGQAKLETRTDFLYDIAYLYDRNKNYFESIRFYNIALNLYIKQLGQESTHTAVTYNNLAYTYANIHDNRNTIKYYVKAANAWEKVYEKDLDQKDYLLTVYQNLVNQYIKYGDLEKTKWAKNKLSSHFNKKYNLEEFRSSSTYFKAKLNYDLATIRLNNFDGKSEESKNLIYSISRNKQFDYNNREHLKYLLQFYNEMMEHAAYNNLNNVVIEYGNKSLETALKYNYNDFLCATYLNLSLANKNLNNYEKAVEYIDKAIENDDVLSFNSTKYSTQLIKAQILVDLQKEVQGLTTAKRNIENLVFELHKKRKDITKIRYTDIKDLVSLNFINIFAISGELYLNQYERTKNKKDLEIASNLYQISSKMFQEFYLKGEFNDVLSGYQKSINEGLLKIATIKKLGFNEKIDLLNQIERNASQYLANSYQNKVKFSENKNNKSKQILEELKAEMYYYKSSESKNKKDAAATISKVEQLQRRINTATKNLTKNEQEIANLIGINFDIKNVLSELPAHQTILKYYVTDENVYCITIEKKEITIEKIDKIATIQKMVTAFVASQKAVSNDCISYASDLKILIPKSVNHKNISIIPDGFLNYLPFEAIYDLKNKQYLVQSQQISYEYSLPIWLLNKRYQSGFNNTTKLAAFSPKYDTKEISQNRGEFKNLLFAEKEANYIVDLFNGVNFSNQSATKTNFIKERENFDIFHLSMHSQLFEEDFNKSSLLFANNEKLYFSDLYGMNIPAAMVVLSACDTGNGALKDGEGIMSMSRALTYAGVKSAVVSLWQVPDKETSEIMISFYENLKKGQAKDEALANAKNIFISKNPMKNHPFYWAGFVVNGDVSPIMSNNNWMVYVAIGLGILILFIALVKKSFQFR